MFIQNNRGWNSSYNLTSRHHRLHTSAIDEGSFDGLCANIRPVDAVLQSIIIHHSHIVNVRHSEGDDVVVIGIINIHPSDLNLTSVKQELTILWIEKKQSSSLQILLWICKEMSIYSIYYTSQKYSIVLDES